MGSPKPYRPAADQKPAPPPALPGPDELDRTARQVRIDANRDDRPVHRLRHSWSDPWSGACYGTACGKVLAKVEGAILTTREATCGRCLAGG